MTGFDLLLRRALYLCAVAALLSVPYVAWKAGKAADSVAAAAVEAQKPIQSAERLISTVNTSVAEAKPKVMETLDSAKAAADEGREAMENTKAATNSLRIAANDSQEFYKEQIAIARSETVKNTFAEALVGVRNFAALSLNANLIARDFRLNTQPRIDRLIDEHTKAVQTFERVAGRPSIGEIFDNGARLSAGFVKTTEIANERLPRLFDDATKLTFHGAGIAESVDIIGKGIAAPKSKKRRVLDFFAESLIKSAPVLLRR